MKEKRFNADKYKKNSILNYDGRIEDYLIFLHSVQMFCVMCDKRTMEQLNKIGLEITHTIRDCME